MSALPESLRHHGLAHRDRNKGRIDAMGRQDYTPARGVDSGRQHDLHQTNDTIFANTVIRRPHD